MNVCVYMIFFKEQFIAYNTNYAPWIFFFFFFLLIYEILQLFYGYILLQSLLHARNVPWFNSAENFNLKKNEGVPLINLYLNNS